MSFKVEDKLLFIREKRNLSITNICVTHFFWLVAFLFIFLILVYNQQAWPVLLFFQIRHSTGSQREAESHLHQPNQSPVQSEVQRDVRRVPGCGADDRWRHHQPYCLLPRHDNRGGDSFCSYNLIRNTSKSKHYDHPPNGFCFVCRFFT